MRVSLFLAFAVMVLLPVAPAEAVVNVNPKCLGCLIPHVGDAVERARDAAQDAVGAVPFGFPRLPSTSAAGDVVAAIADTRDDAGEALQPRPDASPVAVAAADAASPVGGPRPSMPAQVGASADHAWRAGSESGEAAKTELQTCYALLQALNGIASPHGDRVGVNTRVSWNQAGCGAPWRPSSHAPAARDEARVALSIADERTPGGRAADASAAIAEPVTSLDMAAHAPLVESATERAMLVGTTLSPVERTPLFGLLALAAFFALLFLALYRRLTAQGALQQPTREAIVALVGENPGITAAQIARNVGIHHRAVRHHLDVLREFGILEARTVGARMRYFRNGSGRTDVDQRAIVALSSPKARALLMLIDDVKRIHPSALARAAALPESTVRWHLRRLEEAGVLLPSGVHPRASLWIRHNATSAAGTAKTR